MQKQLCVYQIHSKGEGEGRKIGPYNPHFSKISITTHTVWYCLLHIDGTPSQKDSCNLASVSEDQLIHNKTHNNKHHKVSNCFIPCWEISHGWKSLQGMKTDSLSLDPLPREWGVRLNGRARSMLFMLCNWIFMHIGSIRRKPIVQSHHKVGFYGVGKTRKGDVFREPSSPTQAASWKPSYSSPASRSYYSTAAGLNT